LKGPRASGPATVNQLLLNLWFYSSFLLLSSVVIPALTFAVAVSRPLSQIRGVMRRFRMAIQLYGRMVIRLPWPWIKVRLENPGRVYGPGPYIFVCNHRSSSDPFLMGALPPMECVQVVNVWPFRIPVLGFFARMAGYLNINVMGAESFFREAENLLNQGVSIIFFPEGTRSGSRDMGTFHGAAFRLFLESGVPIVPVCIAGNERVPPKGSLLLEPGTVRLRILPPVLLAGLEDWSPFQLKNHVRDMIQKELNTMEAVT